MNKRTKNKCSNIWMVLFAGPLMFIAVMSLGNVVFAEDITIDAESANGSNFWSSQGNSSSSGNPLTITVKDQDVLIFNQNSAQIPHGVTFNFMANNTLMALHVRRCDEAGQKPNALLVEIPTGAAGDACQNGQSNLETVQIGPKPQFAKLQVVGSFSDVLTNPEVHLRCFIHSPPGAMEIHLQMAPEPQPTVDSFSAAPVSIDEGQQSTLTWTTTNADSVSIDNSGGTGLPADGNTTVSPATTTTYTLTATGAGGTASGTVTVTVNPIGPNPPTVDSFTAAPSSVDPGQQSTLTWTTTNADSVSIDNSGGTGLPADGNTTVSPAATTTYTLTATGAGGTATGTVTVTVNPIGPNPPTVDSFTAAPSSVDPGQQSTLTWTTTNADSVSIDNSGGTGLPADGNTTVSPAATTTYTLTATGAGGTATGTVTVTVNPIGPNPPTVDSFTAAPSSVDPGQQSTLTWTTTNADSVSIDNSGGTGLPADGNTTVSPAATTTYTLTATGAGGTATGTVTVTVNPIGPNPPTVDSFTAAPSSVDPGQQSTLTWTTTNADSVSIDNGGGTGLPADGNTTVSPAATTTYTLTATGAGGTATGTVTVTVNPPDGDNQAPNVDAGPDQTITLPDDTASLNGTVTDDGRPMPSTLTTTWTQVSGLGTANFTDASAVATTVMFTSAGTYPLRLEANDGALLGSDVVVLTVREPGGEPCDEYTQKCPQPGSCELSPWKRISEMTPAERECWGYAH